MTEEEQPLRVGIAGSTTELGRELREQLAAAGHPGEAVKLLALEEVAGTLTEYGDEARVLVEGAREEFAAVDVVCFCGEPSTALEFAEQVVDAGAAVLDCSGALSESGQLVLPAVGVVPPRQPDLFRVPDTAALLLAAALDALGRPTDATATVLAPASDAGVGAIGELAEQAAASLRVDELPIEVLGRRLAFDAWPLPAAEDRLAAELAALDLPAPSACVLRVGFFHVAAAALHLPDRSADDVEESLAEAGIRRGHDDEGTPVDSPTRAAGRSTDVQLGRVWSSRAGTWAWLLLDNLQARAAAALATITAWQH